MSVPRAARCRHEVGIAVTARGESQRQFPDQLGLMLTPPDEDDALMV